VNWEGRKMLLTFSFMVWILIDMISKLKKETKLFSVSDLYLFAENSKAGQYEPLMNSGHWKQ
jgi:hypothetical protein